MLNCPVCRGPMKPLFTSLFCPKGCDRPGRAPRAPAQWPIPSGGTLVGQVQSPSAAGGQAPPGIYIRLHYLPDTLSAVPELSPEEAATTFGYWTSMDNLPFAMPSWAWPFTSGIGDKSNLKHWHLYVWRKTW